LKAFGLMVTKDDCVVIGAILQVHYTGLNIRAGAILLRAYDKVTGKGGGALYMPEPQGGGRR